MVKAVLISVVLPAPFGPSSPKILPCPTERLTSRRARTSRRDHQRRKVFETPAASNAKGMSQYTARSKAESGSKTGPRSLDSTSLAGKIVANEMSEGIDIRHPAEPVATGKNDVASDSF